MKKKNEKPNRFLVNFWIRGSSWVSTLNSVSLKKKNYSVLPDLIGDPNKQLKSKPTNQKNLYFEKCFCTVSLSALFIVYFRSKSQYCYENITTGHMQWEYPVPVEDQPQQQAADTDDDEMDICTTPPPNDELHDAAGPLNGKTFIRCNLHRDRNPIGSFPDWFFNQTLY